MRAWMPVLAMVLLACGGRSYKDRNPVIPQESDADTDADADTDDDPDDTDDDPDDTDEPPPTGCDEDADEPNDDFDEAIDREVGVELAVTEDSPNDYWTFDADAGVEYVVTVTHDVSEGNLDLRVYNPSEASVAGGSAATSNPVETVTFTANQTGAHFVRVELRTGLGSTCNTYDLDVTAP